MKTMTIFFAIVLALFFPELSRAQTILISDIDDTIKESHVLDRTEALVKALELDALWQMPQLYQALAGHRIGFFYVSNAPAEIMEEAHREFLAVNQFPSGQVFLPPLFDGEDHKIKTITQIIESLNPTRVIFIGDNGERDSEIYGDLVRKFSMRGIQFSTFIRVAYSGIEGKAMVRGQIPFVSAGEVALKLWEADLLSREETQRLVSRSNSRGIPLGLPGWIDCRPYRPELMKFNGVFKDIAPFQKKIEIRCSYPGEED